MANQSNNTRLVLFALRNLW